MQHAARFSLPVGSASLRCNSLQLPFGGDAIWPGWWIAPASLPKPPAVLAFRRRFTNETETALRFHVSADERYLLYLDGQCIGRGSERGDPSHWFYETYETTLSAGEHCLVALVWYLGDLAPGAQLSSKPSFLCMPDDIAYLQQIATGEAEWEVATVAGITFECYAPAPYAAGPMTHIEGAHFPWGIESGGGTQWEMAQRVYQAARTVDVWGLQPHHCLLPGELPDMSAGPVAAGRVVYVACNLENGWEEVPLQQADDCPHLHAMWQTLFTSGVPVELSSGTTARILLEFDTYYCAYPHLVISGGAGSVLSLRWMEALHLDQQSDEKGARGDIDGKFVRGPRDTLIADGGTHHHWPSMWWRCGRFVEVVVQVGAEPLTLDEMMFEETRYPLSAQSTFTCDDPSLTALLPMMVRTVQMCAHESYMDCPYYEQLMYVADARIEALVTYAMSPDRTLPRKALQLLQASLLPDGLVQARYPATVVQRIPPFALWWIGMLSDYAFWRNDLELVQSYLPTMRHIVNAYQSRFGAQHLLAGGAGWNFTDWVPGWERGVEPTAADGISATPNWQFALILEMAARLEEALGVQAYALDYRASATKLQHAIDCTLWDEERGLYANNSTHSTFSEHAQCLALLCDTLSQPKRQRLMATLLDDDSLTQTTFYFSHYLFDAYYRVGRTDRLIQRLTPWRRAQEQGMFTVPESPEPTRSDCHGWGAHPFYHYFASILGIRPNAVGFQSVCIAPQLGPLRQAAGTFAHPLGPIDVAFHQHNGRMSGTITLPESLAGVAEMNGKQLPLRAGTQHIPS